MSRNQSPPRYQFFILGLRLQPTSHSSERSMWRLSLEDPNTTERSGFKNLTELHAFLQAWMDDAIRREDEAP
jgi:hypothetical protein